MLEIFQSAAQCEVGDQPDYSRFAQTIENTRLLETLGFRRELPFPLTEDALRSPNPEETTEQSEKTNGCKD